MKRTLIKELKNNEESKIAGYVESIRNKGNMQFLILRDSTGFIQITVERKNNIEIADMIDKLTLHSFISVEGKSVEAPYVKNGGREFLPTKLEINSIAEILPITMESGQDLRLSYRWIDLRDEKKTFYFKIQTAFERYSVDYFTNNGFINIHTPKITALSSEGGSEVFELKNYFGQKAYLTQSPQLYKQMAMMAGFDKVFEIGEYFRANPSFTNRHDTEFHGIDTEISFIESHHEIMDLEESWLKYVMSKVKEEYGEEYIKYFGKEMIDINYKFPRITLREVYKILEEEKGYVVPRQLKGDLDPEAERLICEYVKEQYGSEFVFVTDFPTKARAFYSMRYEEDPETTKTYDLLFKGVEITSGAQREHRYSILKEQIRESGINPENMSQYLEFFKYGAPTHGGFGISVTRVLFKLFDLPSVKDVTFLFRGPNRLTP
jgi:aspartyl-tRNA synthetase